MGRPRSADYTPANEFYFKTIDTPVKAYLFGLLWADGCTSQNRISMGLKSEDAEALIIAHQELGGRLKHRKRYDKRTKKTYEISDWYVNSKELVVQLSRRGFRTSPKFDKKWFPWFLLGFFDGDGNIHLTKTKQVQVTFAAPKNHNWTWFYKTVKTFGKFVFTEVHRTGKDGYSGSDLRIYGREALRLLDFIQQGSLGFNRKRRLYLDAKTHYAQIRNSSIRRKVNRVVS